MFGFEAVLGVRCACAGLVGLGLVAEQAVGQSVTPAQPIAGQPLTIEFAGSESLSELDVSPNPFLDRRLEVAFVAPSGRVLDVPGYFAGNGGDVASVPPTLTGTGNVWRVRFTPDEPGAWTWAASFRAGAGVAVDDTPMAGMPLDFDGASGGFTADPIDPAAPGFLGRGKLLYTGGHYLQHTDGTFFLKGGVDSPENWLGYIGFDNTFDGGGADVNTPSDLHEFPTHVMDWNPGDPDWDSPDTPQPNDGRAIIGALNYLASTGVNSIYFLPMSIGGDAQDAWPYADPGIDGGGSPANNNLAFDVTKLTQWEIFFRHAQEKGLLLHFVLNEAEGPNKRELDDATLGVERRLFYREMIARYSYLPGIQWNISEEFNLNLDLGVATVLEFAAELKRLDPYGTPVAIHNAGSAEPTGPLAPFIGQPDIDLPSIQQARRTSGWGDVVEAWRVATTQAGKPLPVMVDEPGSPTRDFNNDFDLFRKQVIWPIIASGGGGEWFINNRDQSLDDFREFDKIWRETGYARRLFVDHTEFWLMDPADGLVAGANAAESGSLDGAEVLARTGFEYVVYYPSASDPGTIDLSGAVGTATARWFNPRTGVFEGGSFQLLGGGTRVVPSAPSDVGNDWALFIEVDNPVEPETFTLTVVNGSGDGAYPAGQSVGIAAAVPPGQVFDTWTGFPVASPGSAVTTLTMPAADISVTATFADAPPGPAVVGLTLVDAVTDLPVKSLADQPVIFRSELTDPVSFNIEAVTSGAPSSVSFAVDGVGAGTESVPPFALFGDSGGDFNAGNLANGMREIAATPAGGAAFSLSVLVADAPEDGDINLDGARDINDLVAYLALYDSGSLAADRDGDQALSFDDVLNVIGAIGAP